jgi:hypothetical protein
MSTLFDFADATKAVLRPAPPALSTFALAALERNVSNAQHFPLPRVQGAGVAGAGTNRSDYGQTRIAAVHPGGSDAPWRGAPTALEVMGRPSLRVYFDGQATVVEMRLRTSYAGSLLSSDYDGMRGHLRGVFDLMVNSSKGPYSSQDLSAMGHPYGIDTATSPKGIVTRVPRRLQRFYNGKNIGHVVGVRGSVPSYAVVNSQSGRFASSWTSDFRIEPDGIVMIWKNTAKTDKGFPYSLALAMGTPKMRSHGPWTYAPLSRIALIDSEWRKTARIGWQRSQMDALLASTYQA